MVVVGGPPTTIPQPWPRTYAVDDWPNAPQARSGGQTGAGAGAGDGFSWSSAQDKLQPRILARITPGGTVTWKLQNRSNLIAGTRAEPDDLFGFYINRAGGSEYRFTFYKRGKYPFYSSTTGVQGIVEVGGPEPQLQPAFKAKRYQTATGGDGGGDDFPVGIEQNQKLDPTTPTTRTMDPKYRG